MEAYTMTKVAIAVAFLAYIAAFAYPRFLRFILENDLQFLKYRLLVFMKRNQISLDDPLFKKTSSQIHGLIQISNQLDVFLVAYMEQCFPDGTGVEHPPVVTTNAALAQEVKMIDREINKILYRYIFKSGYSLVFNWLVMLYMGFQKQFARNEEEAQKSVECVAEYAADIAPWGAFRNFKPQNRLVVQ